MKILRRRLIIELNMYSYILRNERPRWRTVSFDRSTVTDLRRTITHKFNSSRAIIRTDNCLPISRRSTTYFNNEKR